MELRELAAKSDLLLLLDPKPGHTEVARLSASNTMSDLIANAGRETLLVTSLNNMQLIRVAELMDAPGVCLVGGTAPCAELVEDATRAGMAILVSSSDLTSTRQRLEDTIRRSGAAGS